MEEEIEEGEENEDEEEEEEEGERAFENNGVDDMDGVPDNGERESCSDDAEHD